LIGRDYGRAGFKWVEPFQSETVRSGIDPELMNSGLRMIKTRRILELLLKHMKIPVNGRLDDESALSAALMSVPRWVEAEQKQAEKKKEEEYETLIHGYLSRVESIAKGNRFGFLDSPNILSAYEDLINFFETHRPQVLPLGDVFIGVLAAYLFSRVDSKRVFNLMSALQEIGDESIRLSLFKSISTLKIYFIASMLDLETSARWRWSSTTILQRDARKTRYCISKRSPFITCFGWNKVVRSA